MNNEEAKKEIVEIENQIEVVTDKIHALVGDFKGAKDEKLESDDKRKQLELLTKERENLNRKLMGIQSKFSLSDLMALASKFPNE